LTFRENVIGNQIDNGSLLLLLAILLFDRFLLILPPSIYTVRFTDNELRMSPTKVSSIAWNC